MIKKYQQYAPLFLRLIIGFGAMEHGWAKLSRGTAGFEKLLIVIHTPLAHLFSVIVPWVELLGGFAILIGAFVGIAAVPLICVMLTAMFSVHLKYGFSAVKTIGLTAIGPVFGPPGFEVDLLYIAALISLIITGAGAFSIDSLVDRRLRHKS
jgi:putative oxidoreductase